MGGAADPNCPAAKAAPSVLFPEAGAAFLGHSPEQKQATVIGTKAESVPWK